MNRFLFKEDDRVSWIDKNNKGQTGKVITRYSTVFPCIAYGILCDNGIFKIVDESELWLEEEVKIKKAE